MQNGFVWRPAPVSRSRSDDMLVPTKKHEMIPRPKPRLRKSPSSSTSGFGDRDGERYNKVVDIWGR